MSDTECRATDRGHVCSHPAGHERWHQELMSGYRWKDEFGVTACTPNPTGGRVLGSDAARAVGRFDPAGVHGYPGSDDA